MKVLMVNGGPHERGCTYTVLTEFGRVLKEEGIDSSIFWIGNKPVAGCLDCRACEKLKKCVFNDRVNDFLELSREADGFLFGGPVHWASASGPFLSFMDRLFYADYRAGLGSFYMKPTAVVMTLRRAGSVAAMDTLLKYPTHTDMPIISSRYWNQVYGSTPEEVMQDGEGIQNIQELAVNMAFFLKCKKAGLKSGLRIPEQKPRIITSFFR